MGILNRGARTLALAVSAGGAAVTTLGAWQVARRLVAPRAVIDKHITPWELGIPYEEVEFRTTDGVTLRGWWLPVPGATRCVVTLTGHYGGRSDTIGIGSALWRRGMNVLLFDYRGRGSSDPSINTLGYFETLDALAAVDLAIEKAPAAEVGVVGYSMGGAVAILAAARDPRIRAVVADSPFASQRRVIRSHFRRRTRLPSFPFLALVELFLPYDPEQVEPVNEVAMIAPRALMLIHGSSDAVTDPLDSEALYRAAGEPKEMWALPGVPHVGAYFQNRTTYVSRVAEFFERHLAADAAG